MRQKCRSSRAMLLKCLTMSKVIIFWLLAICAFDKPSVDCAEVSLRIDFSTKSAKEHREHDTNASPFAKFQRSETGYLFTEIHIGEPAQLFTVVVSTMTPYIAVPSVFCNEESTACSHHKKYNATKSKTHTAFERDLTVQIDGSDASGYFSRDKFAIANHEIPEQLFLEVTKFDSDAPDRPFDGVLGFAFRQKSMGQAAVTLDVMREEHQKTKRGNLNGFGIVAPKSHDATLIIGTSTRNLYVGPLNVIQLVKWSVQWSFPIQRITFPEGDEMPKKMKKNWMGIIEPAVNHLAGPEAIIEFINVEKLNAQYEDDGWYHVDCKYISTLPEIVFTINKIEYPISSERYILKLDDDCVSLFVPLPPGTGYNRRWLLGTPFIFEKYIFFSKNPKSVSIGEANNKSFEHLAGHEVKTPKTP